MCALAGGGILISRYLASVNRGERSSELALLDEARNIRAEGSQKLS